MPQVSVVVLTYNPDNRKLRQTLTAIAAQQDVSLEVLISDDGSGQKDFAFLPGFMEQLGLTDYRLLAHEENRGTVESCLSAVREARGEYVFLTSPGDFLYDDHTLCALYRFSREQSCQICFGNAVFYAPEDGAPVLTKTVGSPAQPGLYAPGVPERTVKASFFGGNWIIGASYFRSREPFLACLEQIRGEAKYMEDTPATAFALADGQRLCYLDRNVVWYEDGTGVSTGASEKWRKLLHQDALRCFTKLKERYPNDPYVDITLRNLSVSSRPRRILGNFLRHPLVMLQLAKCKRTPAKTISCPPEALSRLSTLLKT